MCREDMAPQHRLQSYYGYAFESWCTSAAPPSAEARAPPPKRFAPGASAEANGWGGDVDTNVQWCSVVKTKLGGTRMVIGGEVDCVRGAYAFTAARLNGRC